MLFQIAQKLLLFSPHPPPAASTVPGRSGRSPAASSWLLSAFRSHRQRPGCSPPWPRSGAAAWAWSAETRAEKALRDRLPRSSGERQGSGVATHHLHPVLLHTAAGLEVGADALACPLLELRELPAAGLDDGLDLLLGLLGDGNHPVQVLIHEKAHKHLQRRKQMVGTPRREAGGLALPAEPALR